MTIEKALHLLDLNSNYTEEDLRKNYRLLAQKYHPDLHEENPDFYNKNMQDINVAYDVLKKALNKRENNKQNNATSNYSTELDNVKKEADALIKDSILDQVANIKEFSNLKGEIIAFYNNYLFKVKNATSVSECVKIGDEYVNSVLIYYQKLKKVYFMYHNINYTGNINLNKKENKYIYDFATFYKELNDFKNIYDKVTDVINEFTLWSYYNELQDKIDKLRDDAIDEIYKENNALKVETILVNLKAKILDTFKVYADRKTKYNELIDLTKDIEDEALKIELVDLEKSLKDDNFDNQYQKIKSKLNAYFARTNNDEYKKLYERIITKLNIALSTLNPVKDYVNINNILNLYRSILSLILKYNHGLIDFEVLKNLDNVTFTNPSEDVNVISSISNNTLSIGNNNMYFCKDYHPIFNKIMLLTHKNNEYIMALPDFIGMREIKVTIDEISTNYISLDDFLAEASEVFIEFSYLNHPYLGLYKNGNLILALDKKNNNFITLPSDDIYPSKIIKAPSKIIKGLKDKDNDVIMYKDREYLKELIMEDFQKQVDKVEEREKKRKIR